MVDLNFPIEWSDGTPAWIYDDGSSLFVRSEEPNSWNKNLPRISPHSGIMVGEFGEFHSDWQGPRLRNVDISMISFDDGSKPVGGEFADLGNQLLVKHNCGVDFIMSWPNLLGIATRGEAPSGKWPKLVIQSSRQVRDSKNAAEEIETLKENPLYGSF